MGTRSRRVASFGRMADDAVAPCSPTPVRAGLHLLNENTFVYFVQPIAYFDDGVAVRRVGGDRTAVDRPVREGLLRSTSTWAVARRSSPCSAGSRTCGPARRPLTVGPHCGVHLTLLLTVPVGVSIGTAAGAAWLVIACACW